MGFAESTLYTLVHNARIQEITNDLRDFVTAPASDIAAHNVSAVMCHVWTAPAVQEENLTFLRIVRVQPCIRPLNAAVLAAGPDVIR